MSNTPNTPNDADKQEPANTPEKRSMWLRVLFMILMALAFNLAATIVGVLAVVQILLTLINSESNERLRRFGQGLGMYLRQIADFLSFATEEVPFPFNDWPSVTSEPAQKN